MPGQCHIILHGLTPVFSTALYCCIEQDKDLGKLVVLHINIASFIYGVRLFACCLHNIIPPPLCQFFLLQFCFSFSHIYPFILGSSETIQFGCNHPGSCSELAGLQPTVVTVSPSLVGNNSISDCHRFCSLVLERSPSSQCKFAFPDGNRISLVVLDDEGRTLAWTCQYARQFFRLIIYVYLIYAYIQYWPWNFHEYFASFLQLSCHSSSLFTPFPSICPSLLFCPLFSLQ